VTKRKSFVEKATKLSKKKSKKVQEKEGKKQERYGGFWCGTTEQKAGWNGARGEKNKKMA